MIEEKNNSTRYAAGLLLGLTTAVAAAFLYKTESGKKVKKILKTYSREAKNHLNKLVKDFSRSEKVNQLIIKELKPIRKKISLIKKNVFSNCHFPTAKLTGILLGKLIYNDKNEITTIATNRPNSFCFRMIE